MNASSRSCAIALVNSTYRSIQGFLRRRGEQPNVVPSKVTAFLAVLVLVAARSNLLAIEINVNFGGGTYMDADGLNRTAELEPIMKEAALYWEDIIEDPWTVNIDFLWDPTIDDDLAVATVDPIISETNAEIRFATTTSGAPTPWWFDPSPNDHNEFMMTQELVGDIPVGSIPSYYSGTIPSLLEMGYRGGGDPNIATGTVADIYTIALHEIGHALGLNFWNAEGEVILDDDFDLDPGGVWGFNVAILQATDSSFHHRIPSALMNTAPIATWERVLPSASDVFAIASTGEWTQIDLPRKDFFNASGSSWNTAANWSGNRLPDSEDEVSLRHGGTTSSATTSIDDSSGSAKSVAVSGGGTSWSISGNFQVGDAGSGKLTISNGGMVDNGNSLVYVGRNTGSTGDVIVDGTGSSWVTGNLHIGNYGDGTMMISGGGDVSNHAGYVGAESNSEGLVTVDGDNSIWENRENLFVGSRGLGTLRVINGGEVTSNGSRADIGQHTSGNGLVVIDGPNSAWTTTGTLYVGNEGVGTLEIRNDGLVTVNGSARFDNSSSGNGTLRINVGPDGIGLLDVTGQLVIGNNTTLEVTLEPGISSEVGDKFTLVTSGGISGTFTNEILPLLAGHLQWTVDYDHSSDEISIEVFTPYTTDYDLDGDVDQSDLSYWQANYGAGVLSGADFLVWQRQYTGDLSPLSASTTVPEPSSAVMMAGLLALLAGCGRISCHSPNPTNIIAK